jgi:hypothetical protein
MYGLLGWFRHRLDRIRHRSLPFHNIFVFDNRRDTNFVLMPQKTSTLMGNMTWVGIRDAIAADYSVSGVLNKATLGTVEKGQQLDRLAVNSVVSTARFEFGN